jgi:hypothetical protein
LLAALRNPRLYAARNLNDGPSSEKWKRRADGVLLSALEVVVCRSVASISAMVQLSFDLTSSRRRHASLSSQIVKISKQNWESVPSEEAVNVWPCVTPHVDSCL